MTTPTIRAATLLAQPPEPAPPTTLEEHALMTKFSLTIPKSSNWKCYLFGSSSAENGITYIPVEGNVPNRFVRWMMKACFACTWVYTKPTIGEGNQ